MSQEKQQSILDIIDHAIGRAEQVLQQTQNVAQRLDDDENSVRNPLTSAEVAALWTQYMNETAGLCINRFMIEYVEDTDIRGLFEYALHLGVEHVKKIQAFLMNDHYPVPIGFTNNDILIHAPSLFSEKFCLDYLNIISLHGCHGYSGAITTTTRQDIREYFTECNKTAVELCNRTKNVLLNKGIYFRPPALVPPNKIEFIKDDYFLSGWFHETRPLSCIEISDIIFNLKKSLMAEALAVAFGQVAESKKAREFFLETVHTIESHLSMFKKILEEDNLPIPPTLVSEITDSTTAPFSDKLMMFLIGFLCSSAIVYYGSGLASSLRKDLIPKYLLAISDDVKIGADWIKIMIENDWLEQPPLAEDRKAISKR